MRIAVISDTHDKIPASLPRRLSGADEVWHLGDVCGREVLDILAGAGLEVLVVRGNCDPEISWPLFLNLERGGVKFHLVHIPPRAGPRGADIVLHGHTHVPRDETIRGVRWLNPGCISNASRGAPASFGWLENTGGAWAWRVERL